VNGFNNKTFLVLLHGKSIETLENKITDYKDLDVVWCGISTFDIEQKYILNKINKEYNIVFDCSTVKNAEDYEITVRIPRLISYLSKNKEYKYICTKSDKNNLFELRNRLRLSFNEDFKKQIIYVEDLGINPNPFCVSLHLYLACLLKFNPRKIILFGADGGGTYGNSIESYYKWEEVKKDKEIAGNLFYNMVGDSNNINTTFTPLMQNIFSYIPEIYNCSPNSLYTVFKNVSYDEVINII
jgi:hypothetical protein